VFIFTRGLREEKYNVLSEELKNEQLFDILREVTLPNIHPKNKLMFIDW
jgi:hypothetical protein